MTLIDDLLQITRLVPQPVAASDGTLYPNAGRALLHDLVELKWKRLLPTLQDGQTVRKCRHELRLSQSELASEAGISQGMLGLIETNKRRITEPMVMNIWSALWRLHKRYEVPLGLETLIRLDTELDAMIVTERVTL